MNTKLIYPSFVHLKEHVYRATDADGLNRVIAQLRRAPANTSIHRFSPEELRHAWNLIGFWGGPKKLNLTRMGDGTFRDPLRQPVNA